MKGAGPWPNQRAVRGALSRDPVLEGDRKPRTPARVRAGVPVPVRAGEPRAAQSGRPTTRKFDAGWKSTAGGPRRCAAPSAEAKRRASCALISPAALALSRLKRLSGMSSLISLRNPTWRSCTRNRNAAILPDSQNLCRVHPGKLRKDAPERNRVPQGGAIRRIEPLPSRRYALLNGSTARGRGRGAVLPAGCSSVSRSVTCDWSDSTSASIGGAGSDAVNIA